MPSASQQPVDVKQLPLHLSDRVRVIKDAPLSTGGDFVLYWMHHAVRSHENPALDTALCVAVELELPVLVYQGLGGQHAFNSDRHHTFITAGARYFTVRDDRLRRYVESWQMDAIVQPWQGKAQVVKSGRHRYIAKSIRGIYLNRSHQFPVGEQPCLHQTPRPYNPLL